MSDDHALSVNNAQPHCCDSAGANNDVILIPNRCQQPVEYKTITTFDILNDARNAIARAQQVTADVSLRMNQSMMEAYLRYKATFDALKESIAFNEDLGHKLKDELNVIYAAIVKANALKENQENMFIKLKLLKSVLNDCTAFQERRPTQIKYDLGSCVEQALQQGRELVCSIEAALLGSVDRTSCCWSNLMKCKEENELHWGILQEILIAQVDVLNRRLNEDVSDFKALTFDGMEPDTHPAPLIINTIERSIDVRCNFRMRQNEVNREISFWLKSLANGNLAIRDAINQRVRTAAMRKECLRQNLEQILKEISKVERSIRRVEQRSQSINSAIKLADRRLTSFDNAFFNDQYKFAYVGPEFRKLKEELCFNNSNMEALMAEKNRQLENLSKLEESRTMISLRMNELEESIKIDQSTYRRIELETPFH